MIFKHGKIIIKINNEKYFPVLMSCASDLYTQRKTLVSKKNNDVYSSINPFGVLLFTNNWKWNHSIPSSLKNKINHNNLSPSLKQDIILWFQKLSSKEKLACISINNSKFVGTFIKMLPFRAKNRIFNLIQEKYIETIPFGQEDSFFDILLKQMRVCWLSQAVIYFNNADLMDIRMLNWLNSVSNNKIFQYAQKGRQQQCNLLWFNKSSYHYLQNWLANQFQTSIIKNYFNKHLSSGYLLQFKAYLISNCKNPEKEFIEMTFQSILSKTEVEMSIIKSKMKQYEDRYGQIRQRQLIENMQSIEQNKKRNKKRNKKKNLHHKYKEVQHNIQTGQDLQNQKLSQICEIQAKIQIHQNINSSDNRQNYLNTKTPEKIKENSPIKVQKDINNQQQIKQSLISSPQTKKTSKNLIYISPKRTRSPDNIPSSKTTFQNYDMKQKYSEQDKQSIKVVQQSSQNNYSFESKSNQQGDIMNKKKRRRCKKQNEQFIEIRKTIWKKMLSRQLNQQVDQLSIETNALYNLKIIAFERVRVFIQSIYPLVNTILFGSNAIGLSLPNSDVDILLVGLPCTYREQASDILAQIAVQINAMGWIISCSTYLGAKVPLIKLEIDPSISFLQTKRKKDLFRVYNPMALYHLDTDQCQKGQTIKVDITINVEGISSIGYESTILMKNWLQKIPQIRSILILFKYILSIRNFNSNFNGGIGSYCLFSMIAAFIKEYNHESNIQMNFINLLKWYGQQFDNLTNVVWLRQQGSCFVRQQQLNLVIEDNKKSLLKLMDPISNKIMNSSCNEYNNIKAEFRRILTQLLQLQDKIDLQMKQDGATLLQLTKMMQSKKGVDRWITKFQNKYGNSVRYIINRHS